MTVDPRTDAFKHLFEPACCDPGGLVAVRNDAPISVLPIRFLGTVLPSYTCSIERVFERSLPVCEQAAAESSGKRLAELSAQADIS